MIIQNYTTFRSVANPGGTIGTDGLPEFDPTNMRANGFSGGFDVSSTSSFPITISCIPTALPPGPDVDMFDWYVSQGTSVAADKPFLITRKPGINGDGLVIAMAARTAQENPDPFDLSTVRVLFFAVDIYVIRRSDTAIQRLDFLKYLLDVLSPKTDIG